MTKAAELGELRYQQRASVHLGLAIVRDCVDGMHGSVTVVSKEGAGSAFTLVWPASTRPH